MLGVVISMLGATVAAALLMTMHPTPRVTLRALSATDVLALPPHGGGPVAERIVVLGDSVATGTGCSCIPFGPRLAQLLTRASHRATRVSTLARDGITTGDLLQQVQTDPATRDALSGGQAVIVTVAANDFDSSQAADGCGSAGTSCYDSALTALPPKLLALLGAIREQAPRARVLLLGYWNVFLDGEVGAAEGTTYQRTSDALTRRVNLVLKSAARAASATYIDLFAAFRGDGDRDDTILLAADGDHPSAMGQQLIAEALARSPAFERTDGPPARAPR